MPDFYRRAAILKTGEIAAPNKGVLLNVPGLTASDFVFHVIDNPKDQGTNADVSVAGATGDIKFSVPAGECRIIPIQVLSLHTLPFDGEAAADIPFQS